MKKNEPADGAAAETTVEETTQAGADVGETTVVDNTTEGMTTEPIGLGATPYPAEVSGEKPIEPGEPEGAVAGEGRVG